MDEDAEFLFGNIYINAVELEPSTNDRRKSINKMYKTRGRLGEFHHLYHELRSEEDVFYQYTRMSKTTFDYICKAAEPECRHQATNFKKPISVEERLLVTLRFLATGMAFRQLAFTFRISKTAVATIVIEVCIAIWKTLKEKHLKFPTIEEFKSIAEGFESKGRNHIIRGACNFNYKHYFSIVLMAVCDSGCKFRIIDVGAYGKDSDGGVLSSSKFYQVIKNGRCRLPDEQPLPNSDIVAPYVFLGDEGFALTNFLLRPYPRRQLQGQETRTLFNQNLSSARVTIERTFGIAAARFRILLKAIETNVENAITIVKTVYLLHNVLIDMDGPATPYTGTNEPSLHEVLGTVKTQQ